MGLTWIDHDTIEQPIEEISKKTAEAGGGKGNLDIEFKVETLRQNRDGDMIQRCPLFMMMHGTCTGPEIITCYGLLETG